MAGSQPLQPRGHQASPVLFRARGHPADTAVVFQTDVIGLQPKRADLAAGALALDELSRPDLELLPVERLEVNASGDDRRDPVHERAIVVPILVDSRKGEVVGGELGRQRATGGVGKGEVDLDGTGPRLQKKRLWSRKIERLAALSRDLESNPP